MKAFVVLYAALAAFAAVQGQETPKPDGKYIDFSFLNKAKLAPTTQEQQQQNETIVQEMAKPAKKYIDYSSLQKPRDNKAMKVQESTTGSDDQQPQQQQQQEQHEQQEQQPLTPAVKPTRRPDPRATDAPTPAPTLAQTLPPTLAPTPDLDPWVTVTIDHDQVKPYAQPEPVKVSEKAGIKFKPQIHITNGCHPYPAVNDAGETSGGLNTKGAPSAGCKGSGWGSQVYGRSGWYKDVWAIMYSWYFPKDSPLTGLGHRHDWEHVIVWIDNPAVENPKILAVTPSAHNGYSKQVPPNADSIDATSVKVNYESKWPINHALESSSKDGDFQDLIMWSQMSTSATRALNSVSWGAANVPMNDGNFESKLGRAWPF